jgi:hypothetical protein
VDGIAPPMDVDVYGGRVFPAARRLEMPDRLPGGLPAPPVGDWFIIDEARCNGREVANPHACDRRCALLWHRSWLEFIADGDG